MNPSATCPQCLIPLPPSAPRGLCPACLMDAAAGDAGTEPGAEFGAPLDLAALRRAFPQLEILAPLGAGGMGRVYKVRQPHLERIVALKVVPPEFTRDPAWVERFTREARALARLNHPNIVQVYDFGQTAESPGTPPLCWLLMEYVDGVSLRQVQRTGGLSSREALGLIPRLCDALQYAHEKGVLHRDIKPENILLDAAGTVKIADFGLAKLGGSPDAPSLTRTGARLGTAAYMAPEQIETPSDVDHRADIYSLGVVFYELLTGGLPLGRFPAPSEKSGTDPRLDHIVFRTLEKERDRRYQAAGEIRTALDTVAAAPPPPPLPAPPKEAPQPAAPFFHRTTRPLTGGEIPVPPEGVVKVTYKDRTVSFPGSGTEALGYGCGWLISAPGRIVLAILPVFLPLVWMELLSEWRAHGLMEKLMPHAIWMSAATGLLAWWCAGPIMRLTRLPERGFIKKRAFVFLLLGLGIWTAVMLATAVISRSFPATGVRALVQVTCPPPLIAAGTSPGPERAVKELWEQTVAKVFADDPGAAALDTPAWSVEMRQAAANHARRQNSRSGHVTMRALICGASLDALSQRANLLTREFLAKLDAESAHEAEAEVMLAQQSYYRGEFLPSLLTSENIFAVGIFMTLGALCIRLTGGRRGVMPCALMTLVSGTVLLAVKPPRFSLPGVLTTAPYLNLPEPHAAGEDPQATLVAWAAACARLDMEAASKYMSTGVSQTSNAMMRFWTGVHLLHTSPAPGSTPEKTIIRCVVLSPPQWRDEPEHHGQRPGGPSFERVVSRKVEVGMTLTDEGWVVSDVAKLSP